MVATTPRSPALLPLPRSSADRLDHLGGPLDGRVRGVDLARALAIVGMIAVHVGPTNGDGVANRLYALPHGRASLLFMLVAGVGVTLLARSSRTTLGSTRLALVWRAALLLPAGLALQQLDHSVNVILQAYALLFVVAALVVALRDRWLLALSAAAFVAGPLLHWHGHARAPQLFDRNGDLGDTVGEVLHGLVLSGPYPLVTWAAPLLFGLWLGRRNLSDRRVQRRLVVIGATIGCLAVVAAETVTALVEPDVDTAGSLWRLTVATPHSQMPLWLAGSTAAAAAVLGASLWFAARFRRAAEPLVITGQLALTIYIAHLLSLHLAPDTLRSESISEAGLVVLLSTVVAVLAAAAWRARWRRGPLERFLRPPQPLLRAVQRRQPTPERRSSAL